MASSGNNRKTYELLMKIAGKVDASLSSSVDSVSKQLDSLNNIGGGVVSTLAKIGSAVGGAMAIRSLGAAVDEIADKGDKAAKSAAKLGTEIEAIQELDYAFGMSGIDDFSSSLEMMQKNIFLATAGGGKANKVLEEFGLDAEKLAKMDPALAIERLSDFMNELPNESDRARLAVGLFGNEGQAMAAAMKMGSQGIQELREEARRTGSVMSAEMAESAEVYNDTKDKFAKTIEGIKVQIFGPLLPYVTEVFEKMSVKFQSVIPTIQNLISRVPEMIEQWRPKITILAENIMGVVDKVKKGVQVVVDFMGGWGNVAKTIGVVIGVFGGLKKAMSVVSAVKFIVANPLILVLGAIIFGISQLIKHWDKVKAALSENQAFQRLKDIAIDAFNKVKEFVSGIPQLIEKYKPTIISVGEAVANVISSVIRGVQAVVDFLGGWKNVVKIMGVAVGMFAAVKTGFAIFNGVTKVISTVKKVQGVFEKVKDVFTKLKPIISGITKGFKAFRAVLAANPVILIIAGIVALIAIFVVLWNKCEAFRNFFINLWEKIKVPLAAAWEWIKEKALAVWEFLKGFWEENGEGIMSSLIGVWESIKGALGAAWDWMKDKVMNVFGFLQSFWSEHGDSVMGALTNAWEVIKNALEVVWGTIKAVGETVFGVLQTFWETWGDTIMSILGIAWDWIKNTFQNVCDTVMSIFDIFKALFQGDWEGAWNGVKDYFGSLWNQVTDTFSAVFDTIWAIFEDFPGKVVTWFGGLWKNFKEGIGKLTKLFEPLTNVLEGIAGFFGNVKDAASGFFSKIGSFLTGGNSEIPGYASGGYVTTPQLATVAEKVPEYIIPRDKSERSFKLWQAAGGDFAERLSGEKNNTAERLPATITRMIPYAETTLKIQNTDEQPDSRSSGAKTPQIQIPKPQQARNGSTYHIEYKPVNNFHGSTSEMKSDVERIQKQGNDDLEARLHEITEDERRLSFAS